MLRYFIYQDAKSHKFWLINHTNHEFVVNFGKVGTIGRWQIKECDDEDTCNKQVAKLINEKTKKGYQEITDFTADKLIFLDDEEYGMHALTSHPAFLAHFSDEIYLECADEETPFGSDEGADALWHLNAKVRKSGVDFDFLDFVKTLIEKDYEMTFIPASSELSRETLAQTIELTDGQYNQELVGNIVQSDGALIAVAFGQIKIMGKINALLKSQALNAIHRMNLLGQLLDWGDGEPSEISAIMVRDLTSFDRVV